MQICAEVQICAFDKKSQQGNSTMEKYETHSILFALAQVHLITHIRVFLYDANGEHQWAMVPMLKIC